MARRKMLEIGKAIFERLMRSETPLPLSKIQEEMGTHFDTLKHHLRYIRMAQSMPKVTVTKVGRQIMVETEKTSEDLEFLKEIIGEELPNHVYVLVDLLDANATDPKKSVPISFFPSDLKTLDEQATQQRVIVTTDQRVYLTPLGAGIAKGAKRYVSLTRVRRKIPRVLSFEIPTLPPARKTRFISGTTAKLGVETPFPGIKTKMVEGKIVIEIHLKSLEMIPLIEEEPQ